MTRTCPGSVSLIVLISRSDLSLGCSVCHSWGTFGRSRNFIEDRLTRLRTGKIMRNLLAVAALLAVLASSAMAQTQNPPAQDSPQNSPINSQDSSNRQVNAPVAGS